MTIHVSAENGESVEGAVVTVEQISKDFPIGSAISKTILGNIPYQVSHSLKSKLNQCRLIKPLFLDTVLVGVVRQEIRCDGV